jgi:hypothetical protein
MKHCADFFSDVGGRKYKKLMSNLGERNIYVIEKSAGSISMKFYGCIQHCEA